MVAPKPEKLIKEALRTIRSCPKVLKMGFAETW